MSILHYHNGRPVLAAPPSASRRSPGRGRPAAVLLILLASCSSGDPEPKRLLSDEQFEALSKSLSEQPQYFDTDNLISNERPYQHLIPFLKERIPPGGAYVGVGPDQNFTYIAATRPSIAFIVDIRRHNLLQHLYLKELLELSPTRVEYLSRLLSRPPAAPPPTHPTAAELVEFFRKLPDDSQLTEKTVAEVSTSLRRRFPELIQSGDAASLRQMAHVFREQGMQLRFQSHGRRPRFFYPTLAELLAGTDRSGKEHGYLSSDSAYAFLRGLQLQNRIIPVIGDLGGHEAMREIGRFLEDRQLVLRLIYVSNVEFYLVSNGRFQQFFSNLSALPVDDRSLLLRTVFRYGRVHPETDPGSRVTPLVQSLEVSIRHLSENRYHSYEELIMNDYIKVFGE